LTIGAPWRNHIKKKKKKKKKNSIKKEITSSKITTSLGKQALFVYFT
jgi:hypothetical protein